MSITITRRGSLAAACATTLLTLGLTAAGPAAAAPGTAVGDYMTLSVDDTTPAPGQVLTYTFDYTIPPDEDDATEATWGFGDGDPFEPGTDAVNLADLSLVPDSCTGDLGDCFMDDIRLIADAPLGPSGTHLHGTAQITVSADTTDGELITVYGRHFSLPNAFLKASPALTLTVDAPPPEADLGVSLSASSSTLLTNRVNYDAAVTNNGPNAATSATITTQLPSQATSIASTTCTYNSANDRVTCPTGAIADGATTHATFTAFYSLLSIGLPLHAQATRTASSPNDPNSANDSDGADCTAVTALLIAC